MSSPAAVRIAAIVPVGTIEGAKSRLGATLDAEERQDLVEGLLERTVQAVLQAMADGALSDVLVVSPDREVRDLAAAAGSRTLRQRSSGLNAGLVLARADVMAGGADAIVVLPIDLPFIEASEVERLAADVATTPAPAVTLVTDRHGTGTNALGLRPPDVIDFAFGPGSRAAHRDAADAAGASYVEVQGPLAFDVDTPDDLVFLESIAPERLGVG